MRFLVEVHVNHIYHELVEADDEDQAMTLVDTDNLESVPTVASAEVVEAQAVP